MAVSCTEISDGVRLVNGADGALVISDADELELELIVGVGVAAAGVKVVDGVTVVAEVTGREGVATALLMETSVSAGGSVANVVTLGAKQSVALTVSVDTMVTVTRPSVPIATVGVIRPDDELEVEVGVMMGGVVA